MARSGTWRIQISALPAPASYRAKFTGKYEHRDLPGAVGHNPPQEDPTAFVQAVVDADRL